MKETFKINQIAKFIFFSFLFLCILISSSNVYSAKAVQSIGEDNYTRTDNPAENTVIQDCYNPSSEAYSSAECARIRLGLNEIKSESLFVPRNPNDVLTVVFIALLAIAFIVTVFRVVIISMQLSAAGDNADKRQEAVKKLVWALVALAIAFSALGITTFIVVNVLGGKVDSTFVDCEKLPENASQELKDKCKLYVD